MSNDAITAYEFFFGAIYLFGFVVLLAVIAKVLEWLSGVIADACKHLTNYISAVTIRLLQSFFGYSFQLLRLVCAAIFTPVKQIAVKWFVSLLEWLKLWQLYWKYGRAEFNSFHSFYKYMRGEGDDREQQDHENQQEQEGADTPPDKPTNAYTDALQLLGFSKNESLDRALLKQRHRELISRVHPDKGCPTPVLAQQINDAVKLVKQKRGWK